MDNLEWYKYFIKTKVILSIALLYLTIVFFTIYFDTFLSSLILGNYHGYNIHQLFPFPVWKILLGSLIQLFVLCFLLGLFVGLKRAIIRNKRFFLRWKLETILTFSIEGRKYQNGFDPWCQKFDLSFATIRL